MNCGERVIEWLYTKQLQVDEQWSLRRQAGFTWWAYQHAQTIEIAAEETGPDGEIAYLISVRTDVVCNISPGLYQPAEVNEIAASASMWGPVYQQDDATLQLCSLVRVHPGIAHWMQGLIATAAVLQLDAATSLAEAFAIAARGEVAVSGHPVNGLRSQPDEMAGIVRSMVLPLGNALSGWQADEFEMVCESLMQSPPALFANPGAAGLPVEFPFGEISSLCQMHGDQPHPVLGNGLAIRQSFPVALDDSKAGPALAMMLNRQELLKSISGYGFGSFHFSLGMIQFSSFLPNAVYKPGLLENLYYGCAGRAIELSEILAGGTSPNAKHATQTMLEMLEIL